MVKSGSENSGEIVNRQLPSRVSRMSDRRRSFDDGLSSPDLLLGTGERSSAPTSSSEKGKQKEELPETGTRTIEDDPVQLSKAIRDVGRKNLSKYQTYEQRPLQPGRPTAAPTSSVASLRTTASVSSVPQYHSPAGSRQSVVRCASDRVMDSMSNSSSRYSANLPPVANSPAVALYRNGNLHSSISGNDSDDDGNDNACHGIPSVDGLQVYHIGIIDILQQYDIGKRMEVRPLCYDIRFHSRCQF